MCEQGIGTEENEAVTKQELADFAQQVATPFLLTKYLLILEAP